MRREGSPIRTAPVHTLTHTHTHLPTNTPRSFCSLSYCDLGDEGGRYLASLMHQNKTLELGLKGNHIGRQTQALFPCE